MDQLSSEELNDLPLRDDKPREYQRFIFDIAKKSNTIVVLPTGTGKTLISLLLIKHVNERDANSLVKKVPVFLAPQATLALQQTNYLKSNCDFEVKCYHGELGCERWTDRTWKKELQLNGCLVMTPAIFETVLRRGYLSMKNVNLIVFDECHNARKNSIYNQIMALHYHPCPDEERPLVFGMTASPMSGNGDNIEQAIKQLETNLYSKAITPDSHSDLRHYTVAPTKQIVPYPPPTSSKPLSFYTYIPSASPSIPTSAPCALTRRPSVKTSGWDGVGCWGSCDEDESVGVDATDNGGILSSPSRRTRSDEDGVLYGGGLMDWDTQFSVDEQEAVEEARLKEFIKVVCEYLDERWHDSGDQDSQDPTFPSNVVKSFSFAAKKSILPESLVKSLSPKLLTLVSLLEQHCADVGKDSFCGIVFTEKRCSAVMLGYLLPRHPSLRNILKVEGLVGHGSSDGTIASSSAVSFSMDIAAQKKVVKKFREGGLNLLVATKVAEEGIDIQPCNLVVRFDMVQTVISNIQSRGRARQKDSKYIVMVNENDYDSMNRIHKLEQTEAEMNTLLLGKMKQEEQMMEETYLKDKHDIELSNDTVYETATGSKMTTFNSIQAIHHYCSMLPQDSFAQLRPLFTTGPTLVPSNITLSHKTAWISSLQLPLNTPPSCRFISGNLVLHMPKQKGTCVRSHQSPSQVGVFNDRLKLSMYDIGPTTDEADYVLAAQAAFGIKKLNCEGKIGNYDVMIPEIFDVAFPQIPLSPAKESAITLIDDGDDEDSNMNMSKKSAAKSGRVLDLAVMLPFAVPDEAISGNHSLVIDKKQQKVLIFASQVPIKVDAARNDLIQKFTTTIFYNALLHSASKSLHDLTALESLIDWATLQRCAESSYAVEQQLGKTKGVVQDETVHDFVKIFGEIGDELVVVDRKYYNRRYQIVDILKDRTPWNQREKKMVLAEFYKKRLFVRERIAEDQPVLVARHLPNMYQTGTTEISKDDTNQAHLIPQFCTPFPIRTSLLTKSALHLPMLVEYLYHRLTTLDIQRKLGMLHIVPPILFQTAFISSATHFLGRSYERLEFLGDAYLKMHLTVHLFVNNPLRDEGWLTRSRTALERNSNLMSASLANRLPGALLSNSMSRKTWAPPQRFPQFVKVSDKGQRTLSKLFLDLALKVSLADYNVKMPYSLHSALMALDMADEEVVNSVHVLIARLQEKLGYRFKNPLVAVEAVTHTSALGVYDQLTSCFQRLELLGDAILGFVLSTLKDELVSNQYLAVCAYRIGLPGVIKQASSVLAQDIAEFGAQLEEARQTSVEGEFFWNSLPHAPKTVSDVLEALIGAVFVDSGCDFEVTKDLIERLVIHDWWDFFTHAGASITGVSNPTREMAAYAERCDCDAFFIRMSEIAGEGLNTCSIEKHKVIIAAATASSKKLARRMAVVQAMPKLKEFAEKGDPNCNCSMLRNQGLSTIVLDTFSAKDLSSDPNLSSALEIANSKIASNDERVREIGMIATASEELVLSESDKDADEEDDEDVVIFTVTGSKPSIDPRFRRQFPKLKKPTRRTISIGALVFTASAGALGFVYHEQVEWGLTAFTRGSRILMTSVLIGIDYKWSLRKSVTNDLNSKDSVDGGERVDELWSQVHKRSAERMLHVFQTNGGVYIKLGQHLNALVYLLPFEYTDTFKVLQDHCPPTSMKDLRPMIKEETGRELEDLFDDFNVEPIGVASLGNTTLVLQNAYFEFSASPQGTLKTTQTPVAVKLQHPHLDHHAAVDTALCGWV
ncbi:P-loop containing nucleoside triphosphate hydrolase protein [Rhizoclosmatium globosum]|uniref:p-loop containing nucleoside triphosphate hydrolase protein n=1 Tax=Rhizoclosmatium globosum TaxID=329046 RepID=A0A1Y2BVR7_9FUNG|nr:P-loop containing nucleoside triphosphate hydrolase protein [Rhizoclosmatium globosum]|eukprot:ORY38195.1 P-loop containing nucleoside triphosphate hydrolase protein [Rhizoclosmatium globosum]